MTIHVIILPFCRQRMFLDAARTSNSSQLVPSCPTNTPACSTLAPMSIAAARMLNSASRSIAPDQHHRQHPPPPPPPPTGAFLQTLKRSLLSRPFWSFFDVSCSSLPSKSPPRPTEMCQFTQDLRKAPTTAEGCCCVCVYPSDSSLLKAALCCFVDSADASSVARRQQMCSHNLHRLILFSRNIRRKKTHLLYT